MWAVGANYTIWRRIRTKGITWPAPRPRPPPALRPPPYRRRHLLTLLQVLDGHRAGATRRELAAALIDDDVRDYSAAEWADSRERKRINRWIAEAVELRDGGYIRLLRGG